MNVSEQAFYRAAALHALIGKMYPVPTTRVSEDEMKALVLSILQAAAFLGDAMLEKPGQMTVDDVLVNELLPRD